MFPKLLTIGSFFLPTYGVLVALGFLAGISLAMKLAKPAGLDPERVSALGVYCALAGLAGAKALMFVMDFDYYAKYPERIWSFDTLLSAGVYYGGFVAALAFAWVYMKIQKMDAWKTADVIAPGVAVGHAIGRLGCLAAGCCWGAECDKPWAITFHNAEAHELTGVPLGVALHPSQLYEALGTALVGWLLWRESTKGRRPGWILGLYLSIYSLFRLAVEFTRHHEQALPWGGPFTWTQWIALALALLGGGILWTRRPNSGDSLSRS